MYRYINAKKFKNLKATQFDFSQNCGQRLRVNAESVQSELQPLWEEVC